MLDLIQEGNVKEVNPLKQGLKHVQYTFESPDSTS